MSYTQYLAVAICLQRSLILPDRICVVSDGHLGILPSGDHFQLNYLLTFTLNHTGSVNLYQKPA